MKKSIHDYTEQELVAMPTEKYKIVTGLEYGDKCPDCGTVFMPETPCDFGYCRDIVDEITEPDISSPEFLRIT